MAERRRMSHEEEDEEKKEEKKEKKGEEDDEDEEEEVGKARSLNQFLMHFMKTKLGVKNGARFPPPERCPLADTHQWSIGSGF